jgi:hypothetical protein
MALPCGIERRFGDAGVALVGAFAERASAQQLSCTLRAATPTFRAECAEIVAAHWQPTAPGASAAAGGADEPLLEAVLELVGWFPALHARCAPLLWERGTDEQVQRAQAAVRSDLDALPRKWWHCICWRRALPEDVLRAAEAGVCVPLAQVPFPSLPLSAQDACMRAYAARSAQQPLAHLEALVTHAPSLVGPIDPWLRQAFELLERAHSAKPPVGAQPPGAQELVSQLLEQGDGLEKDERLASAINKQLHTLLCAVRSRIQAGNSLHTDEQLLIFAGCQRLGCTDNSNSALLADLMEAKLSDREHIAPLVRHVLCARGFHHTVRDSALRAMMRLRSEDRGELQRSLLQAPVVPLQTLFSLVVSVVDREVIALVRAHLEQLSDDEDDPNSHSWYNLLSLIRDANPAGAERAPHTWPRALGAEFSERFLLRYLVGDKPPEPVGAPAGAPAASSWPPPGPRTVSPP